MKAMRGRIAVPKHFVRNPWESVFYFAKARQRKSPSYGGLSQCARVLASLSCTINRRCDYLMHSRTKLAISRFTVFSQHPMQRQSRHEKEKYNHDAQLDEKQ
jgi:hypothetical protein